MTTSTKAAREIQARDGMLGVSCQLLCRSWILPQADSASRGPVVRHCAEPIVAFRSAKAHSFAERKATMRSVTLG